MGAKYKLSLGMVIVCNETGEERDAEAELCMNSFPEKMQRRVDGLLADGSALEDIAFFINDNALCALIGHAADERCYLAFRSFDEGKNPLNEGYSVCGCSIDRIKELN